MINKYVECRYLRYCRLEQYLSPDISLVTASSGRKMLRSDVNGINSIPINIGGAVL